MSDWYFLPPRAANTGGASEPSVRLVCLPHAGGGAVVFQPWARSLPPNVEIWAARLPGRETRFREPPWRDAKAIVAELAAPLLAAPRSTSLAIYGHSMGALLGFDLAHTLAASGLRPDLLVVSGRPAPHRQRPPAEPLHRLPDQALVERLVELYGGIPKAILDDREMMALFLPVLRGDMQVVETYRFVPRTPADWPLMVYGGRGDRSVGATELAEWQEVTRGPFRLEMVTGDHFFLQTHREAFLERLMGDLRRWCALPG